MIDKLETVLAWARENQVTTIISVSLYPDVPSVLVDCDTFNRLAARAAHDQDKDPVTSKTHDGTTVYRAKLGVVDIACAVLPENPNDY